MTAAKRDEPPSPSTGSAAGEGKAQLGPAAGAPIGDLPAQVSSAVRGAIAGVMANQPAAVEMPDLDLDFSLAVRPTLSAETERALAAVPPPSAQRQGQSAARRYGLVGALLAIAGAGLAAWAWLQVGSEPVASSKSSQPVVRTVDVAAVSATLAPVAEPAPTPPIPALDPLEAARRLMQAGQVVKARETLTKEAAPDRPDTALLLARSFDPNYLEMLPTSDAKPDVDAARLWYTRWFDLASKAGEVPSTMRLDLLLRSLGAHPAAP